MIRLAAVLSLVVAGAAQAQSVTIPLKTNNGAAVGRATFTAAPKGVLLILETHDLKPGWHGLHLHEKADCSKSDFTSAGGHVHGGGERVHGLLNPAANEAGDLPNLFVGADGLGNAEVFTALTTLAALRDADGASVVIHANPDDHLTQPIGGAGPRIACGELK